MSRRFLPTRVRGTFRAPAARVLDGTELPEALALCQSDPVSSTLALTHVETAVRIGCAAAGGRVWGYPERGPLVAVCWAGVNLVPVVQAGTPGGEVKAAAAAFADEAARHARRASSIVGERTMVLQMWESLAARWPTPREIRADQPSLAIDRDPDIDGDPLVRLSSTEDMDLLYPACVAMFTEEVGYSPVFAGGRAYEARVHGLVSTHRSYVRMADEPPRVLFKAELGAVTHEVAQVQGVWVDPRSRGRGLAAPAMSAVVRHARLDTPIVSLYVNDYNEVARAVYRKVGFEQVGTYATVLF